MSIVTNNQRGHSSRYPTAAGLDGENEMFAQANLVLGYRHAIRGLASADVLASLFEAEPSSGT